MSTIPSDDSLEKKYADCPRQELTDKELLIQYGFKAHHIIEYPDGSAVLNYEVLRQEILNKGKQ